MKVLITIRRSPAQRYLVSLLTGALVKEVRDMIAAEKYSQAMVTVFTRGRFERQIREGELATTEADLMLTEHNACWDLTKK